MPEQRTDAERLVVAAAIVEHGRLLAARRRAPEQLRGRWELPGGKAEPGESPAEALRREIGEELGYRIAVGAQVGVTGRLPDGRLLRAYECRPVGAVGDPAGEPVPHEHDAVRWLAPEELDEVAWLEADRPLVEALRDRLLDGESLQGGAVGGAARIGGTVRRPTGPWTPAVHALLDHLAASGLDGVPRVLGRDSRGREVLSHLPGRIVEVDVEEPSDAVLVDAVRWLRRFHEAVSTFRPAGPVRWRQGTRTLQSDEIICHNDPGAYNWIVAADRFVGVIDWDLAGPGRPVDDLGFLAWTGVPLFREVHVDDVVRRLRLVARTYGDLDPVDVLHASVGRMVQAGERIAAGQAAGDAGMLALGTRGEPARTAGRVARLRERMPPLLAALGRSAAER